MSTFDDDDIEFDFFDEPETQEATQRRRLPRFERPRGSNGGERPPRAPIRPPTGFTPLLRLLGLIALLIFIVLVLVFWVESCQGASKHSSYQHYMDRVRTIAQGSAQIGTELQSKLTTPGTTQKQLESAVRNYAARQGVEIQQAKSINPPGPIRAEHSDLIDALQLRATGLTQLGQALSRTASSKDASSAGALLSQQALLVVASDVNWVYLFKNPTVEELKAQHVTGVAVPDSRFFPNPELASARSMVSLFQRLHGASTGGTPSGKHGDGLVAVKALPQGIQLSTSRPTTIRASTDLAFQVTVENSGCCQEVGVPVTLTIQSSPHSIVKRKTIDVIGTGEQKTVEFTDIGQPPFGAKVNLKVEVAPVPGETNTSNNSATYPVFFSIG